jgi:hypothetical protein
MENLKSPLGLPVYFVEHLTLLTWGIWIWPRFVWRRLRRSPAPAKCYVFEGSRQAIFIARAMALPTGIKLERLQFNLADVHDEAGRLVRLRIDFVDLALVQQAVAEDPEFRRVVTATQLPGLRVFLGKSAIEGDWQQAGTLRRALLMVQLCRWKTGHDGGGIPSASLFLERRLWTRAISQYASGYGVHVITVPPRGNLGKTVRRLLPRRIMNWLRARRYRVRPAGLSNLGPSALGGPAANSNGQQLTRPDSPGGSDGSGPRIAVEYYGQFNLDRPELYSDLFFWQRSSLPGKDLLLLFSIPRDPLDEEKLAQLVAHQIRPIVLHPGATTLPNQPVFKLSSKSNNNHANGFLAARRMASNKWSRQCLDTYQDLRMHWTDLFAKNNVKVYVTWFKYGPTHCAITDSLASLGGLTVMYQRAFEGLPSPSATICADIVFGFSREDAQIERLSNSIIRYHVTTGYMGDHRFPLLAKSAQVVRSELHQRGAKRILAFFDENSHDDPRWHTGHALVQQNYAFLLDKVLSDPSLALVLKPKVPGTLRRRLGPVAEMLDEALATGRCHLYGEGVMHSSYPPAAAALVADIAIHGHLCAGTAGMEAALAGVPTLLLDREGWPESPLYRLGVGRVVFTNWEELWQACLGYWSSPGRVEGFGDWSPILDELDPFRDGRGAERMGTYLDWLLDGFKRGLDREAVMAEAAERYCSLWGKDKVTEVNGGKWRESVASPS